MPSQSRLAVLAMQMMKMQSCDSEMQIRVQVDASSPHFSNLSFNFAPIKGLLENSCSFIMNVGGVRSTPNLSGEAHI
jgi:hypothetical protein